MHFSDAEIEAGALSKIATLDKQNARIRFASSSTQPSCSMSAGSSCILLPKTSRQRVNTGLKAARRRGIGGRPKALGDSDLKKGHALLRSGDYTKVQVAEEPEVSRHTPLARLVAGGSLNDQS